MGFFTRAKVALAFVFRGNATAYNASGTGRRFLGWNAPAVGPNQTNQEGLETLWKRSRDVIRNSSIARSAIDKWESNVIGCGIVPHFNHPDPAVKTQLNKKWAQWVKKADFAGQLSFYGLQSLVVREAFEAGECFVRFHVDSSATGVPLTLQLIEAEQVPLYANDNTKAKNTQSGIVFDDEGRRIGYQMYKGQPYDAPFGGLNTYETVFVDVDEMLHVMKPLRAGQLRGVPQLASVITLLKDLDEYADAERVRKKTAALLTIFVTKPSPTASPIPYDSDASSLVESPQTQMAALEPGQIQELLPGEGIETTTPPADTSYVEYMQAELRKLAAGCGLTYEQLSGDLSGVNYSSIRAGLLEMRRSCEQFQFNCIVQQFCEPVLRRWLQEAVLSGELDLPDFATDPEVYEAEWITPSWKWVDPAKEIAAQQMAVRCGFTSQAAVIREMGEDPEAVMSQIVSERRKAKTLDLVFDSDPNRVTLVGKPYEAGDIPEAA